MRRPLLFAATLAALLLFPASASATAIPRFTRTSIRTPSKGPASYMTPGQKFWDTQSTPGGWYRGTPDLKRVLVKAGLPPAAPATRAHAHRLGVAVRAGAGAGIAVCAGALGLLYRRRRSASH